MNVYYIISNFIIFIYNNYQLILELMILIYEFKVQDSYMNCYTTYNIFKFN